MALLAHMIGQRPWTGFPLILRHRAYPKSQRPSRMADSDLYCHIRWHYWCDAVASRQSRIVLVSGRSAERRFAATFARMGNAKAGCPALQGAI